MTLDQLPIITEEILLAHESRCRSKEDYEKWQREVRTYLADDRNLPLDSFIEFYAMNSKDPEEARIFAYSLLTFINHGLEAEKMDKGDFRREGK